MNKFVCAVAICFVLCGQSVAQHCRITVRGDGSTGSGTLVRKTDRIGTILTCAHLFSDSRSDIVVMFPESSHRANLVRLDKANDLAVLEIQPPACQPFPLGPDPQGPLTAGGFGPNGQLRFIRGRINGHTSPPHVSTVISGSVRSGDSGGGVFDDQNRIVGVVWGESQGETYVTCGEPVRAILASVEEKVCYGGQCYPSGPTVITGPIYSGQVVRPPMPPQQPQPAQPNNPALPSPPQATTPSTPMAGVPGPAGPAGPQGPPGPAGKDGSDATCECGPKWEGLEARLGKIEASITAISNQKPPAPSQPTSEEHVVIVADHNAPYWQRLAEAITNARKTYSGIQDTTLPSFNIGVHPQAVVYRNSVPVRVVKGQYEVENLLSRLSRGEAI